MLSRESSATLMSAVTAFIYKEARLQDEHQYEAWEALWTDDALYWVPAGGDLTEPGGQMSVIYDNRNRIATRLNQLRPGRRDAQSPPSGLRRVDRTAARSWPPGAVPLAGLHDAAASCEYGRQRDEGASPAIGEQFCGRVPRRRTMTDSPSSDAPGDGQAQRPQPWFPPGGGYGPDSPPQAPPGPPGAARLVFFPPSALASHQSTSSGTTTPISPRR